MVFCVLFMWTEFQGILIRKFPKVWKKWEFTPVPIFFYTLHFNLLAFSCNYWKKWVLSQREGHHKKKSAYSDSLSNTQSRRITHYTLIRPSWEEAKITLNLWEIVSIYGPLSSGDLKTSKAYLGRGIQGSTGDQI